MTDSPACCKLIFLRGPGGTLPPRRDGVPRTPLQTFLRSPCVSLAGVVQIWLRLPARCPVRSPPAFQPLARVTAGGSGPCLCPIRTLRLAAKPGGSPAGPLLLLASSRLRVRKAVRFIALGLIVFNCPPATLAEPNKNTVPVVKNGPRCAEEHSVRKANPGRANNTWPGQGSRRLP